MPAPAPIKPVGTLDLNGHEEIVMKLDAPPTEEFMVGFRMWLDNPKASVSTAFKKSLFDRFEGTTIVFHKTDVDWFAKNQLPAFKEAIAWANRYAAQEHERREVEAVARAKARKDADKELEIQRERARQIRVDE